MPYKTPGKTNEYIRELIALSPNGEKFMELTAYADEHRVPILLPETVAFLKQILRLYKPKKILEIGTAIGYSGLVMMDATEAELITLEIDENSAEKAKSEFEKWGYSNRAKIFVGDACEIIPLMQGEYDFIFVDGPKTRYIEFLPYLKKMLVNGGILFCDNVLFNGMVAGEQEVGKKKNSIVEKLDLFLKTLFADGDFSSSILPVGDGVSLSIKKKL